MEIEKKYLVKALPENLDSYPFREITQSYICRSPVIRLRRIKEAGTESYVLTVKGDGLTVRQEYELPLTKEQYENLRAKEEGRVLSKTRYLIPLSEDPLRAGKGLTAEVDLFHGDLSGLQLVEVEFESLEEMEAFVAPDWFGEDVSDSDRYHNSTLSR